jgi:hypothetical protein
MGSGLEEFIVLALTREEAMDLFERCMQSDGADSAESESVLKKLASLLFHADSKQCAA